jgi:lipopolysaccharide transport system ATP-binding protein
MSDDVIIRAEGLGKQYRIGSAQAPYGTFRDAVTGFARRQMRRWGGDGSRSKAEFIWALREVSFEVRRGEVLGIIGRNGAGKSTLLKILSKITHPTEGRVELRGRVGSLLEVGTGFHPELTGRENIFLNGAILGMTRAEIKAKFDEIVSFAETEKFLDTPVKHYSSGMYMRLAFAVAAHLEPEILLVDEVLAVGDAEFQKKCLGKMGDVAKSGRTVLFVSHNLAAVQSICDNAVVLTDGVVSFSGSSVDAVRQYLAVVHNERAGFSNTVNHPGRPPGRPKIIQSIGLVSRGGDEKCRSMVLTGEEALFEIVFDCGDYSLDYALIGICSRLGERVCTVGTHHRTSFMALPQKGTLFCRIPSLNLAAGEYSVLVVLGHRNPTTNIDLVENAMRFWVESGDYFVPGAGLRPGQGYLALKSEWKVCPNSNKSETHT